MNKVETKEYIVPNKKPLNILVIGESAKDVFIFGDSVRISPESAAPILIPEYQIETDAMASNTYRNILSILENKYKKDKDSIKLITNHNTTPYITKTRYVMERTNSTLLRVDVGDKNYGHISEYVKYFYDLDSELNEWYKYDAIIISDYNKGFLKEGDIEYISNFNNNIFLDTKKTLGPWCKNVKFIKLNQEEYDKSKQYILDNKELFDKLIITMGAYGACYKDIIYPVKSVPVKGVSGLGDSFFGGFCVSYLKTGSIIKSIKYGNKIATICAQKAGVSIPYER